MPIYRRQFERGQLQFITTSTYRRTRLFTCPRFCWTFVEALRQLRQETGFPINGWVLMPDHFHLLIWPEPAEETVRFMQELKKRTAQQIIAILTRNQGNPRACTLLTRLRLPSTVHSDSHYRVWQRRYVPSNAFSHKKHMEKLDYMHNNPAVAKLVASPDQWPWSCLRNPGKVTLRNMIARLKLQGSYRWNWSLTTGESFTPAESFRFAEAAWGPIVLQGASMSPAHSWVSVNDPAIVVFRLGAELDKMTVWLMNYSGQPKQGVLSFNQALRGCAQTDLEGKPLPGGTAALGASANQVEINLEPWHIAALELH